MVTTAVFDVAAAAVLISGKAAGRMPHTVCRLVLSLAVISKRCSPSPKTISRVCCPAQNASPSQFLVYPESAFAAVLAAGVEKSH